MIEVQLFTQSHEKTILTFNNNVLEYFYGNLNGETKRYHVGQIKSIEITTDKNGKHTLVMSTKFHTRKEEVSEGEIGQVLSDKQFMDSLPTPGVPTKIYAGIAGPCGRYSPFGEEPNDGVLTVKENFITECSSANSSITAHFHHELKDRYSGYCEDCKITVNF